MDAPTSRMMPVSRRRLNAVRRIVVATSRTEQTTIRAAITHVPMVNLFSQVNSGSRMRCWSCTSSTPGAPVNELVITAYFFGSDSLTRKLSGIGRPA